MRPTLCAVCVGFFPVEYTPHGTVTGPHNPASRILNAVALMKLATQWEALRITAPMFRVTYGDRAVLAPGTSVEMFACTTVAGTLLCSTHAGEQLAAKR